MTKREKFLPKVQAPGKLGYFPPMNDKEWDALPIPYKAMEWFPFNFDGETVRVEYVEFDTFLKPYNVRASVKVHRQEVHRILFQRYSGDCGCHLGSIRGAYLSNGRYVPAKWKMDSVTGAFEVIVEPGYIAGKQGGFGWFVPNVIEETKDGFKWRLNKESDNPCHLS